MKLFLIVGGILVIVFWALLTLLFIVIILTKIARWIKKGDDME